MQGESLIAARLVLYLFATFSILIIPLFSVASLGVTLRTGVGSDLESESARVVLMALV